MGLAGTLVAIALPWLLGGFWLGYLQRLTVASRHSGMLVLGYGGLLGVLFATLPIRLLDALGYRLNFWLLTASLGCVAGLGLRLWYTARPRAPAVSLESDEEAWKAWAYSLLLALLLIRLGVIAAEIWLLPLYPWDAWTTWTVRARVWFELKSLAPFVDAQSWLADGSGTLYTIPAWNYPLTVSLLQLWMALGYGQWDESVNNLLWLFLAIFLGLGFYGQALRWGVGALTALCFTYLLLSLPIVDMHIALAGYADLWMAAVYGFAAMAFFQWVRTGDRFQGWLALVLALSCPLIKLEGAVWLLTFAPPLLVALIAPRRLLWLVGIGGVAVLFWFLLGGVSIRLPLLGPVQLKPELIELPYLGRFELGFKPNWEPFIQNFLVLDTWHLFWYLVIAVMLFSLRRILQDRLLLCCTILIVAGFAMLFVLFFMTGARLWAEQYTSINRLFLHMTPALMFYLMILVNRLLDAGSRTAPVSASPPA